MDNFPKNKALFSVFKKGRGDLLPPPPRELGAWGGWVQKGRQFDVLHEKIDL